MTWSCWHWQDWAARAGIDSDAITARILTMANRLPEKLSAIASRMGGEGLHHPAIAGLVERLTRRAERVSAM